MKASLLRFDMTSRCLKDVLLHTATFYRRDDTANRDTGLHIAAVIVDILCDSLRGKTKITPSTLAAMLTVSAVQRQPDRTLIPSICRASEMS